MTGLFQKNGKQIMQLLNKETKQQQAKLAEYCRTGIEPELIDINKNNLYQYRRLVFNIASDTLETAYPITYSFLPTETWEKLVYDFFAEHKCQTTQVWRMPLEFYDYCKEKNIQEKIKIPFLNDLLYFEWLELDVHTMEDIAYPKTKEIGSWLTDVIALNPEHRLIQLSYPVHTTAPTEQLEEKQGDYFLLIYREKESGRVQFFDLSMLYVFIIENISNGLQLSTILEEANTLLQINDMDLLTRHALTFLEDLKQREFVLGFLA